MIRDDDLHDLLDLAGGIARAVGQAKTDMDSAFARERAAEQEILLLWLEELRPSFAMLADRKGPIHGLRNGRTELPQVVIDKYKNGSDRGEWLVADHDELGLVIARKPHGMPAALVWPGGDLPTRGEGGPRLACVLEEMSDRLVRHAMGKSPRKRQEALAQVDRIRALETLLWPR